MSAADNGRDAGLRGLPSVDAMLREPTIEPLLGEFPRSELIAAIRLTLDRRRIALRGGESNADARIDKNAGSDANDPASSQPQHANGNGAAPLDMRELAVDVRETLYARARPHLRRVINATGVVLHTNLGRAPLAAEAIDAIADIAAGYCNLEFDLEDGQRGDRHAGPAALLRELTGAEDALVVNNNAAAVWLTLSALTRGCGVVISRGQLVEIGGSYRIPDIMAAADCRMVEVGTTNRTRLRDYERAIDENTAALLRVHTSNFRVRGFVEETPLAEMARLAHERGLLLIDDLGSGLLHRDIRWPAPINAGAALPNSPATWDEPTVAESLAAGADVTLFSGDKLLGGPQAGLIVGRAALIARIRSHPLTRAVRPDKLQIAALDATLRLYRDPQRVAERVPALRMLS
ncbi:MAG: L-seryl-tRNA(Sec) selenium transferase, partial [Phycisphaerales bacterium]|nr:L-seryl-tRNA(Sec) selenium transferase [Phycisphaerales bacterium]